MAANRTNIRGRQITAAPTNTGGGVFPGDPVLVGQIPAVTLNGGANALQSIDTLGVYQLWVKGTNGANIAVNEGDIVYHDGATLYDHAAGTTTPLSKTVAGTRFGYAVSTQQKSAGNTVNPLVASGATALISVRLGY